MNFSIKKAVLAAVSVGGLAAGGAAQALDLPTSDNGSLVLFVTNTTTNQVYVRDLGLHMNDLIAEGTAAGQVGDPSYGAVNVVNLSIGTIGPDALLTSFLATGSTSEFTYNIIGGDSVGANNFTDPRRFALTSTSDLPTPPSNTALGTLGTSETGLLTQVSNTLAGANSIVAPNGAGAGAINIGLVNTHFNQAPQTTVGALDSSMNFFVLSSTTGSNATPARVFVLNDLTLGADGTLYAASQVPLPAAVWLFSSGLLGLAGIGRRRKLANRQLVA